MLFSQPRLNIHIFLQLSGWKYSRIILKLQRHDISVLEYTGVSIIVSAVFSFCYLVLLLKERNKLKTYNCTVFTDLHHTKLYHFQNLSLGLILKVFLEFLKFQPRYSYKKYSYRKKKSVDRVWLYQIKLR